MRSRINDKCDTPFWDPIAGKCLNSGFTDETRAIGPNGANLTSTGSTNTDGADSQGGKSTSDGYQTFGSGGAQIQPPVAVSIALVALSAVFAAVGYLI